MASTINYAAMIAALEVELNAAILAKVKSFSAHGRSYTLVEAQEKLDLLKNLQAAESASEGAAASTYAEFQDP